MCIRDRLKASNKTCPNGKPFSTSFTANDANKNDLLTFELIEKSVEGAKIEQAREGDRRIRFEMPVMEPGKYSFKIKVTDNGFPSKSSIEEFAVTVKPPPKPKDTVVEKETPPEVDYIQLVKVTGISRDITGERQVWILLGHNGDRLRLAVGESCELGEKKYEVVSIDQDEATFAGDEKTFLARLGWSSARPDFTSTKSTSKKGKPLPRGALIETNL